MRKRGSQKWMAEQDVRLVAKARRIKGAEKWGT